MRAKQALPLRGGQAVLRPGNSTCYKAVYFNVERATYIIAGAQDYHPACVLILWLYDAAVECSMGQPDSTQPQPTQPHPNLNTCTLTHPSTHPHHWTVAHTVRSQQETSCCPCDHWPLTMLTPRPALVLSLPGWFLLWFLMASRGLERLASAWLEGQLCPWAAAAVLVNQASLWYSTSALIHYTNDYWFDFYWSQMYYTLSEGYLYVLAAVLLRRDAQPPLLMLVAALGVAVYHIAQLLLDEALNMAVSMHALRRGTLLLVTDVSYIGALVMASVSRRALQQGSSRVRFAAQVAVAAVLNAAVFYLVFADRASYGASR